MNKPSIKKLWMSVKNVCKLLWGIVSHNLWMKLLALVLAVLLWNYVISTNTSITRTKTLNGLTGYISGQSTLNDYGLALKDNPTDKLSNISVVIDIAQAQYAKASSDNVQVTLDLSNVRTAGTREVRLKASTSYGRVVRIMPDTLTLTFEALDSRSIPINVQIAGEQSENMWYNVTRSNPSMLSVSGAESLVQSISKAYVYVDVTGADSSFVSTERYVLLDSEGKEIPQAMLTRSSSSISVSMDVYPTKEIPISADMSNAITGQPAEGYVVESVTIQPDALVVAADRELLDDLTELHIQPISVDGLTQNCSVRTSVSALSAFKFISADEVYVNVAIAEETVGAWVDKVDVSYVNKGEELTLTHDTKAVRVYITGPKSAVESLKKTGFVATVDLNGLGAGQYDVPLLFPTETYSNIAFIPETAEVNVTLTSAVKAE